MVKRLRLRPFTAETWVRIPLESYYPGGGIDTCGVVKLIDYIVVQAKVDASFRIHQLSAQSM